MPSLYAGLWGPEVFESSARVLLRSYPFAVYNAGTNVLATLYSGRDKAAQVPNPTVTDNYGNGSFFAEPGFYDVETAGYRVPVYVNVDAYEPGVPGPAGRSVLYGAGAPAAGTGADGDFYIQTGAAPVLYGPKAAGAWPAGVPLVGPQGVAGTAGKSTLNGAGAPAAGTGNNGDFYIQTAGAGSPLLFGPKVAGAWPVGVSMVGPQGAQGIQGPQGVQGNVGPQGPAGAGLAAVVHDDTATLQLLGNGTDVSHLSGNVIAVPWSIVSGKPTLGSAAALDVPAAGVAATSGQVAKGDDPRFTKKIRIPHTWDISGDIAVPAGDTNFIMPFFVPAPAGQTTQLVGISRRINSGTSATVKIQRSIAGAAYADVAGFTALSATTADQTTFPTAVTLAAQDKLLLVVTAISGAPKNLTVTVYLDYSV